MYVWPHFYGVFAGFSAFELLLGKHCGKALLRSGQ